MANGNGGPANRIQNSYNAIPGMPQGPLTPGQTYQVNGQSLTLPQYRGRYNPNPNGGGMAPGANQGFDPNAANKQQMDPQAAMQRTLIAQYRNFDPTAGRQGAGGNGLPMHPGMGGPTGLPTIAPSFNEVPPGTGGIKSPIPNAAYINDGNPSMFTNGSAPWAQGMTAPGINSAMQGRPESGVPNTTGTGTVGGPTAFPTPPTIDYQANGGRGVTPPEYQQAMAQWLAANGRGY